MSVNKPQIIAFYLPQYHPTHNNNKWWGEGFTEWTNVAKARKLYPGHYQPKIPADLGFYDLRVSETRKKQALLAKNAGIDAFCYYHYWFEAGKEELDLPFKEVVKLGEPDFPFCLCWANETWHTKFWNKDGSVEKKPLIEQKYLGEDDNIKHFYSLLPAFQDRRYLRYKNKLLFMIYQPFQFEGLADFMQLWNTLALKNGLNGFHFVAQTIDKSKINEILKLGFNAVNLVRLYDAAGNSRNLFLKTFEHFITRILNYPFIYSYKKALKVFSGEEDSLNTVYPTLIPNWDHTPRSNRGGYVLHNCTPKLFQLHAKDVISKVKSKPQDDQIIFLKSWNEWGEGNYMEPDMKYGDGYIAALRNALSEF